MVDLRLIEFIKKSLERGISVDEIKLKLLEKSWLRKEIDLAFSSINSFDNRCLPKEDSPEINSVKDPISNEFSPPINEFPVDYGGSKKTKVFWIIFFAVLILLGVLIFRDSGFFSDLLSSNDSLNQNNLVLENKNQSNETNFSKNRSFQNETLKIFNNTNNSLNNSKVEILGDFNISTLIDCKQDFNCFINNSQECKESKVIWNYSNSNFYLFGLMLYLNETTYMEMKGFDSEGKCLFNKEIKYFSADLSDESIEFLLSQGLTMEEINQQKDSISESNRMVTGAKENCTVDSSTLFSALSNWNAGNINFNSQCELKSNEKICTHLEGDDLEGAVCVSY